MSAPVGRVPLPFGRVVVIGGGCYGSWYAQQLTRAIARGALAVQEILVVDRDADCPVAARWRDGAYAGVPLRLVVAPWDRFLAEWLAEGPDALVRDAMVPSPLMPHLCLDWLVARARDRWPSRRIAVQPLSSPPPTPWQRAAPDGRHYVSFATWMCPVNCIEPAKCPETRGERDWSLPLTLRAFVADDPQLDGAVIFPCVHRAYGVGMIDAAPIAEADRQVASWGAAGPCRVLVGTVSHCHGALGVLAVD
jgi:hypothetical protein